MFKAGGFGVFFHKVLLKQLLPHLCNPLRSLASLQPGRRTRRRLPASWLKGGEKPDSSGRERSRSVCKERRRTGKKRVQSPRSPPPEHRHMRAVRRRTRGSLQHVMCSGGAAKSWSAGGQRSGCDSRPRLSVSSRRRRGGRRRSRDEPRRSELRPCGKPPCCRSR